MIKKTLCLLSVFAAVISLSGKDKLHFYTDFFAWYPDGKVKKNLARRWNLFPALDALKFRK